MRNNISVPELWEAVPGEDKKAAAERHAEILKAVQDLIIANISSLRLTFESEEESRPATMRELQMAVSTARTEELERFLNSKDRSLFFEGGYVTVKF